MRSEYKIRGRYAPSPSGKLHVGNARTAFIAWLSARSQKGSFIWRLEDLDGPRVVPGMAEQAELDLRWLGLDWDEGPGLTGKFGPYKQSERAEVYENALDSLFRKDFLFPCTYSRKDLQSLSTAPHGPNQAAPYPRELRPNPLDAGWYESFQETPSSANLRFKVPPGVVKFDDRVKGPLEENVAQSVGDFVVKRRDGMYAYQLAVVVDDLAMQITEVVRGADLLDSTARQIQLIEALGGKTPAYAHVPLVRNAEGEKLSKRDAGLTLEALREAGVTPEQLIGCFMHSLGLLPQLRTCSTREAVTSFDWDRVLREDWVLPENFERSLLSIS